MTHGTKYSGKQLLRLTGVAGFFQQPFEVGNRRTTPGQPYEWPKLSPLEREDEAVGSVCFPRAILKYVL